MKKLVCCLLVIFAIGALAACAPADKTPEPSPSPAATETPEPSPTATIDKSRPTNIEKFYEFQRKDWDELSDSQKATIVSMLILDASPDIEDDERTKQAEALVPKVEAALSGDKTMKEVFDSLYTPADEPEPSEE